VLRDLNIRLVLTRPIELFHQQAKPLLGMRTRVSSDALFMLLLTLMTSVTTAKKPPPLTVWSLHRWVTVRSHER
jgi:hypothetical protein